MDLLVLGKTKNPFLYSAVVLRMEQVKVDGLRHRGRKYLHWNRNQSEGNAATRYRSMGHRKVRDAKNVPEAATTQRPCSPRCGYSAAWTEIGIADRFAKLQRGRKT